MCISDWSSDVCSSDLIGDEAVEFAGDAGEECRGQRGAGVYRAWCRCAARKAISPRRLAEEIDRLLPHERPQWRIAGWQLDRSEGVDVGPGTNLGKLRQPSAESCELGTHRHLPASAETGLGDRKSVV